MSNSPVSATQLWRTKFSSIAKQFPGLTFVIADEDSNIDLIQSFEFQDSGEEINIGVLGEKDKKYAMEPMEEFEMDEVVSFLKKYQKGFMYFFSKNIKKVSCIFSQKISKRFHVLFLKKYQKGFMYFFSKNIKKVSCIFSQKISKRFAEELQEYILDKHFSKERNIEI